MNLKGILSSLMLLLLLASCASTSEDGGDDYEDDTASEVEAQEDSEEAESVAENELRSEPPKEEEFKEQKLENALPEKEPPPQTVARATPPPPKAAAPEKGNKHEVLSRNFERATLLAEMGDFDLLDDPQPLNRCLASKPADPDTMMEMVIRQMAVNYPGKPSFGPLFPGSPPKVETSLVIGKNNGWVTGSNLTDEKRRVFELHQLGNTLIIKILPNPFGIYQDFGNPAEVWIRKSQDGNLFFKVFKVDAEQNRAEAFVGYCFKNG
jgi:hypothetical protein